MPERGFPHTPNCSLRMRFVEAVAGIVQDHDVGRAVERDVHTATLRISVWSATAATGRFSGSSTSIVTRATSGSSAPFQRRAGTAKWA